MNIRLDRWQGIILVHAIFLLLLFYPLLLGNGAFAHKDARMEVYPFLTLFDQHIFTPSALWNSMNFHGFPAFLTNGYLFHPLLYLLLPLLSPVTTLHWTVFLYLLGGALFFTLVLKREGFSPLSSITSGAIFSLALWPWMFAPGNAFALLLTPLLLYAIQNAMDDPKRGGIMGSIVVALAWLGVHFHYAVILMAIGAIFAVVKIVSEWSEDRENAKTLITTVLVMFAVGTLIGLIRTIPAVGYSILSPRSDPIALAGLEGRTIGTLFPFLYLLPQFNAPFLSGAMEALPYIGALPLALVLIAITKNWKDKTVLTCLGVYVLMVLIALPYSPLRDVLYWIPGFKTLGSPARWMFAGTIALLPICAMGFDLVAKQKASKQQQKIAKLFLWGGTLLALVAVVASILPAVFSSFGDSITRSFDARFDLFLDTVPGNAGSALSAGQEHIQTFTTQFLNALINGASTRYGLFQPHNFFPIISIILTGILLSKRIWTRIPTRGKGKMLLVYCLCTLLIVYIPMQWRQTINRSQYETPSNTVAYLKENSERTFSFLPGHGIREALQLRNATRGEINAMHKHTIQPNENLLWGLNSADYYEPLHSKRMGRLLGAIGSEAVRIDPEASLVGSGKTVKEMLQTLGQRYFLFNILGIDHVVSSWPLQQVGLRRVHTEEVTERDIPVYVFRNPDAQPLAYFVSKVEFMEPNAEEAFNKLVNERRGARLTLIECEGCEQKGAYSAEGTIQIDREDPTSIQISTYSPHWQWLVVSQNLLPGWRVKVDGEYTGVGIADTVYPAILLSPNEHTVNLKFNYWQLLMDSISLIANPDESVWR